MPFETLEILNKVINKSSKIMSRLKIDFRKSVKQTAANNSFEIEMIDLNEICCRLFTDQFYKII